MLTESVARRRRQSERARESDLEGVVNAERKSETTTGRERERVDRALEIDNVDDVATMSGAVYRHILSFSSSAFFRRGVRDWDWDWDCPSGLNSIKARQPTATILTDTDTDTRECAMCVCV